MLIVISDAGFRPDEAGIINTLFDEGLELFHLRKPEAAASEIQCFLDKINPGCFSKIALHQQHQLVQESGLKRLHFPEAKRRATTAKEWLQLKAEGFHLSTSVHRMEDVVPEEFAYAFYGPVFDSISKKGYTSIVAEGSRVILPKEQKSKWIAIGGVDENNCPKAREMGFDGVAVLGAVWQAGDPVKQFKRIKEAWSSIVPLS